MTRLFLTLPLLLSPIAAVASGDIKGTWRNSREDVRMVIKRCGTSLCGRIAWLKNPNDSKGKPRADAFNEQRRLRRRPLLGLQIAEFIPNGSDGWAGFVYLPEDGKSYSAQAQFKNDGTLAIGVCVIRHECAVDTWTRTND
jgi:uncharacterized protein (DUF2147 family)